MTTATELREKSVKDLKTFLSELLRKRFKLSLLKASGELEKTHELKAVRRDIAKTLTVLNENEQKGAK